MHLGGITILSEEETTAINNQVNLIRHIFRKQNIKFDDLSIKKLDNKFKVEFVNINYPDTNTHQKLLTKISGTGYLKFDGSSLHVLVDSDNRVPFSRQRCQFCAKENAISYHLNPDTLAYICINCNNKSYRLKNKK